MIIIVCIVGGAFLIGRRFIPPGPPVKPGLDSLIPPGPPIKPPSPNSDAGSQFIKFEQPPGPPVKPGLDSLIPPGPPTTPGGNAEMHNNDIAADNFNEIDNQDK